MTTTDGRTKIFGIGLNKTGTTTLGKCGEILGYRCMSCNREILKDVVLRNDFSRIKDAVNRFDLFEDWPWPLIYKQLDSLFPGSKFILTTRINEHKWFDSLKKHSMKTHPIKHCRKLAYGYHFPHKHKHEHLDIYRKHNEEVRNHFKDRKHDFLEICWENGDGFEKLCNFLGKEVPGEPIPHARKGQENPPSRKRYIANKLLSIIL